MREEAELLARQEAYARAAAEPIVIDNTPRPLPRELNETLETVAEQGEDEETGETGEQQEVVAEILETESRSEGEPDTEQAQPQGKTLNHWQSYFELIKSFVM